MKNPAYKSSGITLVELMVAVTILGLIAAIAIPKYNTYTVRTKVTELMHLASNAKSQMSEYILMHRDFPQDEAQAGINQVNSQYLENLSINDSGAIILKSNYDQLGVDLTLVLQATNHGHTVTWRCSALGDVDYAPSSCR